MSCSIALFVASISFTLNMPLLSLIDQCRDERRRSLRYPWASDSAARMTMSALRCVVRRSSVLKKFFKSRSNSAGLNVSLHRLSNRSLKPSSTHAANATISSGRFARSKKPRITSICVPGTHLARCCAYTIHRKCQWCHFRTSFVYWMKWQGMTVDRQGQQYKTVEPKRMMLSKE
jgi:hypothetical protein